jgi:hypothetical protein
MVTLKSRTALLGPTRWVQNRETLRPPGRPPAGEGAFLSGTGGFSFWRGNKAGGRTIDDRLAPFLSYTCLGRPLTGAREGAFFLGRRRAGPCSAKGRKTAAPLTWMKDTVSRRAHSECGSTWIRLYSFVNLPCDSLASGQLAGELFAQHPRASDEKSDPTSSASQSS